MGKRNVALPIVFHNFVMSCLATARGSADRWDQWKHLAKGSASITCRRAFAPVPPPPAHPGWISTLGLYYSAQAGTTDLNWTTTAPKFSNKFTRSLSCLPLVYLRLATGAPGRPGRLPGLVRAAVPIVCVLDAGHPEDRRPTQPASNPLKEQRELLFLFSSELVFLQMCEREAKAGRLLLD